MRSHLKAGVAAVSLAALSMIAGCGTPAADAPSDGAPAADAPASIRIGVSPDQLAGVYGVNDWGMYPLDMKAVFDSLFLDDPDTFGFQPNIATEFERSDDWKTVKVTLRDDVAFVDGEELTADALVTYLEGVSAVEGWTFAAQWGTYEPVLTVEDETTVTIASEKPMDLRSRGFLSRLFTEVAIASPNSLDDIEATATEPLGSGPYIVESATPDVEVKLVRNPDYWGTERYPFDTMTLTVFADDVAALNALKAGQIDATRLSTVLADEARNQGFELHEGVGRFTAIFVADRAGSVIPALADQRVRQAMALAFDRQAINETLNLAYGDVTSQPFLSPLPEYVEGGDDRYGYDPERAKELMAEAGYADGFDLTIPSTPFLGINAWEPVVQQYLGDIGIRVTFDPYAATDDYFTAVIDPNYPVLMYSEVFIQALPVFITDDAIFNSYEYHDETVNELWGIVQSGPDEAAEEAAAELGEYVLDQAFLVPFTAPKYLWASTEGFEVHVGNSGENLRVVDFLIAD